MIQRRSLRLPITLAVVMIVLLVVLTVGWVWLTVKGAFSEKQFAGVYWAILSVGTTFLALVVAGVVVYLALAIKAINLTRRQSNFIDSVTHELKSPIASLKLYLQTLDLRPVSAAEQENFHRYMLEDVERLDHLINHVLDAGRLERASESVVEDVALPELLRECAQTVCLRYRVPAETIAVETEPCVVRAPRVDLEIIFRNLVDNAVKYAGTPPHVEVTQQIDNGRVVTRIADNGPGIPVELRRKIFGRFVRLGLELERQKAGTGLGLYLVRTLVRRLKGQVRVQDPENGCGTLFEVDLPGRRVDVGTTRVEEHLPAPRAARPA